MVSKKTKVAGAAVVGLLLGGFGGAFIFGAVAMAFASDGKSKHDAGVKDIGVDKISTVGMRSDDDDKRVDDMESGRLETMPTLSGVSASEASVDEAAKPDSSPAVAKEENAAMQP